jgi:hypothetical protein
MGGGSGVARRPSGLPSIADSLLCSREPPLRAICGLMRCGKAALYSIAVVGDGEHREQDNVAERFAGLNIDDQLDGARMLASVIGCGGRGIGGLGAFTQTFNSGPFSSMGSATSQAGCT